MNERPLKRRRRVTTDSHDFFTLPDIAGANSAGPFRSTIQAFLKRLARLILSPSLFPCLPTWQILLRVGDSVSVDDGGAAVVTLYVVEEDVVQSSRSVYCDQCRVVGWSGHPVCTKRYHFVIPASNNSPLNTEEIYQKECKRCGNTLQLSDFRCKSCNTITEDHVEGWLYHQLENNTHLLHGVIHSNGYGHLLTLNGREGGSKALSGRDIMGFWDGLCQALAVRKISVMDVSTKYGVEYRLLHSITKGHTWYGDWGYEFGTGSYALTLESYNEAVANLSSMPLSLFSHQSRRPRTHLQDVIAFYQSISDMTLVTLRDLFSFMLRLIHKSGESLKPDDCKKSNSSANELRAWTKNDIERVEQALTKLLIAAGDTRWVSMRALKGALCKATSPELLDYCLKHLEGKRVTDSLFVCTQYNPINAAIEFRPRVTRELAIDSATKLLDCKQFIKDYKPNKMAATDPFAMCIWCHVELADHPKDDPAPALAPPPELIILHQNSTVADLKLEATKAFQEAYIMFKKFEAEQILDYGDVNDSMTLKLLVGPKDHSEFEGDSLAHTG